MTEKILPDRKSYHPKESWSDYIIKSIETVFGLFLFAFATYVTVQANVGLSPWVAFSIGFSNVTGIDYGIVHAIIAVIIIGIDLLLKEKIGWGTLGDAVIIGPMMSIFDHMDIMPLIEDFWTGIVVMIAAVFATAVASFFYMDGAFSCGPRDALMVALCRIFSRTPVGAIRICLEGGSFLVGWLLGAKAGLGTVLYVFGIGIALQIVFKILKFDVTRVQHESFIGTHKGIMRLIRKEENV